MKRTTAGLYRQGDVLVIPANHPQYRKPQGQLTVAGTEQGRYIASGQASRFVLAFGEVTGHAHVVPATTATLSLDEGGVMYLTVAQLTEVQHEEHAPVALPPMAQPYQVTIQREWSDALEPRQVAD